MDNFFSKFVLSAEPAYRLGRHFFFWLTWWMFLGFIYGFLYNDSSPASRFLISYSDTLLYLPQHILLSYGIIYYILPKFLFQNNYWLGLTGVLLLMILAAALSPVIQKFVINPIHEFMSFPAKRNYFLASFMGGLRGAMTIAGFAVAIKLLKHWYFKKIENEILEKEKLKAELALLRGQMHPHFIFNTLNGIYSLALKKSEHTAEAILKLSDLMRYMFTEINDLTIPLSKEIEILNIYISLAKLRYRQRLDMVVNVAGDFSHKKIAPLLLLPFLENSFKYGAHDMLTRPWISLDLTLKDNALKLKLINGKSEPGPPIISSGVGISNVKKRLRMLYPAGHELRITQDDDSFVVVLTIQLEKLNVAVTNEEVEMSFSG